MSASLDQLVAAVAPGDAITGQAFAWREVLRRAGVGGSIYAQHVHPELLGEVAQLGDAPRDGSPVLLRYSLWSDAAALGLRTSGPLGMVYHNITPAHLVRPLDPNVARLCAEGRRALPAFRHKCTTTIADSEYNAAELRRAGWSAVNVIPLLLDLPNPPPVRDPVPPVLLFVGRVVPSKRIDDLIRVLAYVRETRIPDARLVVIGAFPDVGTHRADLEVLARDLGVGDAVDFRGRVSDAERDAAYATAGAYVSMSEHEGFCAPLLEAMSLGLPVVARAAGAVPETAGRAALLVPGRDIPLAGEAVAEALSSAATRRGLRVNAEHRLSEFRTAAMEPRILDAVDPLLRA